MSPMQFSCCFYLVCRLNLEVDVHVYLLFKAVTDHEGKLLQIPFKNSHSARKVFLILVKFASFHLQEHFTCE